jgi:hypothetical protein
MLLPSAEANPLSGADAELIGWIETAFDAAG